MLINSFEQMENIISNSKNMNWNGWSVVVLDDTDGYYTKDGVFVDGRWQRQYSFSMLEYGVWNIPDRFLTHVQV